MDGTLRTINNIKDNFSSDKFTQTGGRDFSRTYWSTKNNALSIRRYLNVLLLRGIVY